MIGIAISNSIGLSSAAAALDPAASAYFAATGITGATQQTAIDNLVKGLKADGLWSKMKAVYPFVTDNRNLLSYTEDFSNAYWNKNNATITSNSTTAPDGTLTADTFTPTTTNGFHNARALNLTSIVNPYTYSVYAKANGYNFIGIQLASDSSFANYFEGVFNLSNGTIENTGRTSGFTGTRQITSIGGGWYRCTISITNATSSSVFLTSINPQSTNDPTTGYAGNGTDGIYLWGAQLELGSTATTYQPIATTQQAFISSQFKFNLVNPVDSDAAFRLVFNGGWTHSSTGATPNGTNGYADTKFNPATVINNVNDGHLTYYSRTNNTNINAIEIGSGDLVTSFDLVMKFGASNLAGACINMFDSNVFTNAASSLGFYHANQNNVANIRKMFLNGSSIATQNVAQNQTPSVNIYIGARNAAAQFNSNRQCAFSSIGNGLTDTEAANLYTRVQAFQTSLNRAVI